MLRTLLADLPRTRTPWEQVLRTLLARALSPQPALSWSRPARSWLANQGRAGAHRRMPWEPGRTASKAVPRLVVMVDVSGSVDAPLLQRFAREVEALTRRLETALVLVIGDDCVRQVLHFAPGRTDLREVAFSGGGGTDFTPLLEEADRHDPDIGVFLTDLDGPARFKPRWPVVWAVMAGAGASGVPTGKLPFGRLLALR
jgi:predicted metal-dependent peptidase